MDFSHEPALAQYCGRFGARGTILRLFHYPLNPDLLPTNPHQQQYHPTGEQKKAQQKFFPDILPEQHLRSVIRIVINMYLPANMLLFQFLKFPLIKKRHQVKMIQGNQLYLLTFLNKLHFNKTGGSVQPIGSATVYPADFPYNMFSLYKNFYINTH